ncbi:MAG TPA: hypothetical protein VEZ13_08635 [Brevibacillus sp.]|nr:hypothetical protein [Brevibacillus sp.]
MGAIGIVAVAVIIAMAEVPGLWKKRRMKEVWVFMLLLFLGTGIGIAESLTLQVPNPLDWITALYKPISDFIQAILR